MLTRLIGHRDRVFINDTEVLGKGRVLCTSNPQDFVLEEQPQMLIGPQILPDLVSVDPPNLLKDLIPPEGEVRE